MDTLKRKNTDTETELQEHKKRSADAEARLNKLGPADVKKLGPADLITKSDAAAAAASSTGAAPSGEVKEAVQASRLPSLEQTGDAGATRRMLKRLHEKSANRSVLSAGGGLGMRDEDTSKAKEAPKQHDGMDLFRL